MSLPQVNELSDSTACFDFVDETGNPMTPVTVTCQIDDQRVGTAIRVATPVVPVGPHVEIPITSTENRCLSTSGLEPRTITLIATYGTGGLKRMSYEAEYVVVNLWKVT